MEFSITLAFIAGLVSFVSPCVLPLVPAYIGYMGGRLTHTVAAQTAGGPQVSTSSGLLARLSTLMHGVAFVAGFTVIFVALGLLAGAVVGPLVDIIGRAGGVLIIFFGLHFMGVMPRLFNAALAREDIISNPLTSILFAALGSLVIGWAFITPLLILPLITAFVLWLFMSDAFTNPKKFWVNFLTRLQTLLYSDTRRQMNAAGRQNVFGSAIMGVVFAAGWTPCIGPILGSVLTMAANTRVADDGTALASLTSAGTMLFAYSLGLGIPFLLTAGLLDSAQGVLRRLQRHMGKVEFASGVFLIIIGVMVATGTLQRLSQTFATGEFAEFAYNLEEGVIEFFEGDDSAEVAPVADAPAESDEVGSITGLADDLPEAADTVEVGLELGNRAPDFMTVTDTGETVSLSDLRGQVVLVNFWATWCGPCRIEMPEFEAAYNEFSDDGFTILAVNNQETLDEVIEFREELNVTFPMVLDESGDIQDLYAIRSYPSTILVDEDGIIINRHFGVMTASQLEAILAEAL